MSLIKLIVTLGIIGWIVFPALKKILGQGTATGTKAKKQGGISNIINEIRNEMEIAAGNAQQTSNSNEPIQMADDPWASLMGGSAPEVKPQVKVYRETPPPVPPKKATPKPGNSPKHDHRNTAKIHDHRNTPTIHAHRVHPANETQRVKVKNHYPDNCKQPTEKNLQEAVIWAEILSPPVALRENKRI